MKKFLFLLVVIVGLALASSAFGAPTLKVGDKAPDLKVGKWVKGEAIDKLDPAKIYVIEFWATWCGPCKQSIPHLTELAKKHKDKVTFVGVSIWERGDVPAFVKNMGDKMDYSVATDSNDYMSKSWMAAAGENGIPASFVVGKGKILWIGHPMYMDKPLEEILAGKYDVAAFADQRARNQVIAAKRAEVRAEIDGLVKQGKSKEALDKLDAYVATDTDYERNSATLKVKLLYATDEAAGYAYVRKLAEGPFKDNPSLLDWLAGSIINDTYELKSPDYALALSVGARAVELTSSQNAYLISRMADIYDRKGDLDKAIETQENAVKVAGNTENFPAKGLEQMKTRLQELKDKKK